MLTRNQPPKRKRGVILTLQGWERLQAAKYQSEIRENFGNPYTQQELSERTNVSHNTLIKIHNRKLPVDKQSLECYFRAFNLTLSNDDYTKSNLLVYQEVGLKFPLTGQVPLNSPFYIQRHPTEQMCYKTIVQPGALICIKAPKHMGKTSLMARILQQARAEGCKTVTLSLQLADAKVLTDLTHFLQWICAIVTRSLELPNQLSEHWDDIFGANYNCTDYFQNYLLANIDCPLVLALDEVDRVFNYPEIANDFFGLIRCWHEKAKYGDIHSRVWQKLRLVVVHSTEVYISLNRNQSPCNAGLVVNLPEFTAKEVLSLASRYQLNWTYQQVEKLMGLMGGNPYLVQLALHHISSEYITLEELLETAVAETGIYQNYLQRLLWQLQTSPELMGSLTQVVMSETPVELGLVEGFKLHSLGLVRRQNQGWVPNCNLYSQYFRDCLGRLQLLAV